MREHAAPVQLPSSRAAAMWRWWVLAAVIGELSGAVPAWIEAGFHPELATDRPGPVAVAASLVASIGLPTLIAQWLVLRRLTPGAWLWLPCSWCVPLVVCLTPGPFLIAPPQRQEYLGWLAAIVADPAQLDWRIGLAMLVAGRLAVSIGQAFFLRPLARRAWGWVGASLLTGGPGSRSRGLSSRPSAGTSRGSCRCSPRCCAARPMARSPASPWCGCSETGHTCQSGHSRG